MKNRNIFFRKMSQMMNDMNVNERALPPYVAFSAEQRPRMKEMYPGISFVDMGKLLKKVYSKLSNEERSYYDSENYNSENPAKDYSSIAAEVMASNF